MHDVSQPPVVCQLVHGLPVGGAEVLVDRIIRRLAHRYRFIIACLDEQGELGRRLAADGFQFELLNRRPGFDWRCVKRLSNLLRRERITLVHAHQYTPFAYAAATRCFGRRPRVLFTEHGRFHPDGASRKRRLFNRVMTARGDRMVAVGNSVRRALIDYEGLPPSRIDVVYNGVDLGPYQQETSSRGDVRRELGVGDEEFLVLQVARLDVIKDHATALRTIAAAIERQPAIRLGIVGDGPERGNIERQVTELGLKQHVKMLGQRRDIPRLLAAADAFLLTSVSEGIPVTIIEAMSAHVPVVATEVGGVGEVIEHGTSGLLARSGDAAALADRLLQLAVDSDLRQRLAMRAFEDAEKRFSESTMTAEYIRIYDEMLADAANGPIGTPHRGPEALATS